MNNMEGMLQFYEPSMPYYRKSCTFGILFCTLHPFHNGDPCVRPKCLVLQFICLWQVGESLTDYLYKTQAPCKEKAGWSSSGALRNSS